MLAATGNSDSIQQLEEVEAQRIKQTFCSAFVWFQATPFIVGFLSLTEDIINVCTNVQTLIHNL